jgi:serine-type D-Ala-D-Ala carboxypeptidase/endopeptidase (penicillin-binding protein 4)
MKRNILILCLIIVAQFAYAQNSLNAVIASQFIDVTTNQVLFEENPNTLLMPASNQKVLSLYSALHLLNIEETFTTTIAASNKILNGEVNNLYFKFSADPNLTTSQLDEMIKTVEQLGLTKVKHSIVIDGLEFDNEYFGLGWLIDQTKFCFSAPISPIIIDHNCFTATASIDKGKLVIANNNPFLTIRNEAVLTDQMTDCDFELHHNSDNTYLLYGCAAPDIFPVNLSIAIQDPKKYASKVIASLLRKNNITFNKIEFTKTPEKSFILSTNNSKPIKELLSDMMEVSDNLIADSLFKKTAFKQTQKSGTWKNGAIILESLLERELNVPKESFAIFDGSGMSRKNLISPNIFTKLLTNAYANAEIQSQFVSYFPEYIFKFIPLNNLAATQKIVAKTGTLENVSALTGYIFLKDQRVIAFSVMVNNAANPVKDLKLFLENYISQVIVDYC